jgi:coenzyme F420-0:L-glutamate ligase/coenzyme F420-1:gamma-L-glutamate ligase
MSDFSVRGLGGIPEVAEGDDLGALLAAAAERAGGLEDGDVVVVAQKVISKAEGRVVSLHGIEPGPLALALAGDRDARYVEAVLREAARLVRVRGGFLIAETRHGFVCASAGVDSSNAPAPGRLVLLPDDADASARRLRDRLAELTSRTVAVLVTDSFGRPWRQGTTDVAVGAAGLRVLLDLKGERDAVGYELQGTTIAVADEIAGAAELAMGKTAGVPAAVVRGLAGLAGEGGARDLVMPPERDLFR